ncbi:MAG: glycosyltransferase [Minisyncoccales bacterium]
MNKNSLGICIVSSYSPRKCGIATYTSSLKQNILKIAPDTNIKIVAINDPQKKYHYSKRVIATISQEKKETYIKAANAINKNKEIDVVNLQHVFSLFGGKNGEFIIDFLKHLKKPVVTTMHMIYSALEKPNSLEVVDKSYKTITEKIISLSSKIIVIIQPMADILESQYHCSSEKIAVIPHGVPEVKKENPKKYKKLIGFENKKIISTFGLIRPKKGLEYLIWAMPEIVKKYPEAIALILGESHPNRPKEYYNFLKEEAKKTGLLDKNIYFNSHYLKFKEIITYLLATDVFITPYLVPEQTSSGVIAYALGCGKVVVSTPFLYAKEMLKDGRGIFINFKDSQSIFSAIDFIFSHPEERKKIERKAYITAQKMLWSKVSKEYLKVFKDSIKNYEKK